VPGATCVQNDWNGSAKVALVSIARSADAWRALGASLGDASAAALGDGLDHLKRSVVVAVRFVALTDVRSHPWSHAFREPSLAASVRRQQ
jgi:hypothetical protein